MSDAYYFNGAAIVAPLTITSDRRHYSLETLDLLRVNHTEAAQRWGFTFNLMPGSNLEHFTQVTKDFFDVFDFVVPQPRNTASCVPIFRLFRCHHKGENTLSFCSDPGLVAGDLVTDGTYTYTITALQVVSSVSGDRHQASISEPLRQPTSTLMSPSTNTTSGINVASAAAAGSSNVTVSATGLYQGQMISFGNHDKLYVVAALSDAEVTLFPNLVTAVSSGISVNHSPCTAKMQYDVDATLSGASYVDGILMDPGTITLIEAL